MERGSRRGLPTMPITTRGLARLVAAAFLLGASGLCAGTAAAFDLDGGAFAPTRGPTTIPIGHVQFCKIHNDECGPNNLIEAVTELTDQLWDQLLAVNDKLNDEIVPVTDEELYHVNELWTYPEGFGDCEDFALAKRRALIEDGWNPSTLLMAVVRERNGAGHAVLMVRTSMGDYVLDNQDRSVRLWSETPYTFVKRQSQENAGQWVLIDDARPITTVASTE